MLCGLIVTLIGPLSLLQSWYSDRQLLSRHHHHLPRGSSLPMIGGQAELKPYYSRGHGGGGATGAACECDRHNELLPHQSVDCCC